MKGKLLSIAMMIVMVTSIFAGCGKKESTYFKELNNMCEITKGTTTAEISMVTKEAHQAENYDILQDSDGNQNIQLKVETTVESSKKCGIKVSAKLGKDTEYSQLTTIVMNEDMLYMNIGKIVEYVEKIDKSVASQIKSYLSQLGVKDAVSINLKQLQSATGTNISDISTDTMKKASILQGDLFTALDKNYKDVEGKDGDYYTLTISPDNISKFIDATVNFISKDAEGLIKQFDELVKSIDKNTELNYTEEFNNEKEEIIKNLKDNKEKAISELKQSNGKIVSKALVTGSDGKREGKLTLGTDGKFVKSENASVKMDVKATMKEGTPTIKDMVPEDAVDLTAMITALLSSNQ